MTRRTYALSLLAEAGLDQRHQCFDHLGSLRPLGLDQDRTAWPGGQHHETHDGAAANRLTITRYPHDGIEGLCAFHELG